LLLTRQVMPPLQHHTCHMHVLAFGTCMLAGCAEPCILCLPARQFGIDRRDASHAKECKTCLHAGAQQVHSILRQGGPPGRGLPASAAAVQP
jgi:hypothetical protein